MKPPAKLKQPIKSVLILISNLILCVIVLMICDFCIYNMYTHQNIVKELGIKVEKFNYNLITKKDILQKEAKIFGQKLRKPSGLEYKSKHSIVIFGCSYGFGASLRRKQAFAHKLSEILKTPVYNRAYPWGNMQEIWYQTAAEGKEDFYKNVPLSDTYIYLAMYDHYNRLYSFLTMLTQRQYINYFDKNENLTNEIQRTKIESILKISYTYRYFSDVMTGLYLKNPKNKEKILNRAVLYISESKKKLQEANKKEKIDFIVLLYGDIKYEEEFIEKLHQHGILTIRTKDLTNEDLTCEKYTISKADVHPNEKAWDLLTPLVAKKIEKIWENKKQDKK